MDCHVNVECALYFGSMKYINKYLKKSGNCGTLEIHNNHDKVQKYIDGHYLSASEAAWYIFQFKVHDINVICLSLHIPLDPPVIFHPSSDISQIIENAENSDTDPTAFFKMNQCEGPTGNIACQLTYQDLPQYFMLKNIEHNNHHSKSWSLWKRGLALSHMAYVGPTCEPKNKGKL